MAKNSLKIIFAVLLVFVFCVSAQAAKPVEVKAPKEYTDWLRKLKKSMIKRGISEDTIELVYDDKDYYHPTPEVVKIDRKQLEFVTTSTAYLNRVVTEARVKKARERYKELYPLFKDLEKKYGVGFHYLIAFWGIETNFGQTFGNHKVVEALTILAYDKRRRDFFTEELYQALKIIDTYHINPDDMEGSWAGAMGHFQFMPTTFNTYAVDYDGDEIIDIWHSYEDAVASAANYLSSIGWEKNTDWGCEVELKWDFDYSLTGRNKNKTMEEWKEAGVKIPESIYKKDAKAAIITPEGKSGKAYLIMTNFHKIMMWNRSENYALAVGILADYIKSDVEYKKKADDVKMSVNSKHVSKIQAFINKLGLIKVDEDGKLGTETREAIKKLQEKAKLPQDGYPNYQLLNKINKYDPEIGFTIPVQPKRK